MTLRFSLPWVPLCAALATTACVGSGSTSSSSSSSSTTSGGSSSQASSSVVPGSSSVPAASSAGGASSMAATSSSAGASSSGAPSACAEFCAGMASQCTGGDRQWATQALCQAHCGVMPVGGAADTSGDTLSCRTYHLGNVATLGVSHCAHAGPTGAGICGTACDAYCDVFEAACHTHLAGSYPYADRAACLSTCAGFAANGAIVSTSGNNVQCRLYHSTVALGDPAGHCGHALPTPTSQCN